MPSRPNSCSIGCSGRSSINAPNTNFNTVAYFSLIVISSASSFTTFAVLVIYLTSTSILTLSATVPGISFSECLILIFNADEKY